MKKIIFILFFTITLIAIAEPNKFNLTKCYELALQNNHELKSAKALLRATDFEKKAAFSTFLPSINFTGSYTFISKKNKLNIPKLKDLPVYSKDPNGNPIQIGVVPLSQMDIPKELEFGENNNFLFNFSLTQPLFTGGKLTENYKIKESLKEISANKLKLTKNEILYKIDKYFWQIVSLTEKLDLLNQYISMINTHITDINNYINEGILTKTTLLKANIKKQEAELKLIKIQNGLSLSKMALNQLIGRNINNSFIPDYNLKKIKAQKREINKDSLQTIASHNRSEIAILSNMKNITHSLKNIERSKFMPNIVLNGGYSFFRPDYQNSFKDEFGGDYNISLICNLELFHFGENKNKLDAAKSKLKAVSENLSKTKELVSLDINHNIYVIKEAQKKIDKAEEILLQAKENLKDSQEQFKEGIIKSSDLLEAQVLWQKSFLEKIDAIIEYKLSLVELKKATGELTKL